MPVFTRFAEWFSAIGPGAVTVFKGSVSGLATAFMALQNGVEIVWGTIIDMVYTVTEPIRALGEGLFKLMHGDFKGAQEAMMGWTANVAKQWSDTFDSIAEKSRRTQQEIADLWGQGTPVGAPAGGAKRMGEFGKTNGEGKEKSAMPELEAQLEALRVSVAQKGLVEGQYRELSKAEEARYWNDIKARQDLSQTDRAAAAKKAAEAELAVMKQAFEQKVSVLQAEEAQYKNSTDAKLAIERRIQSMYQAGTKEYEAAAKRIAEIQRQQVEQERQMMQIRQQMRRDAAMGAIALEEQASLQALQLGMISQQQAFAAQVEFEERRTAVAREFIAQRIQDAEKDPGNPVELQRLHAEREALEQQHQLKIAQIKGAAQVNSLQPLESVFKGTENSVSAAINGMLSKTMTMRQGVQSVMQGITQSVQSELSKQAAAMAMAWVRQRAMALSEIFTNSAKAGSGAAASQAAIPVVGPALAVAAMATTFAAVSGMAGKVPSAMGGWKVPKGINPLTQVHEEEMILPKGPTQTLEHLVSLFEGGKLGAGQGSGHTFNIHALDSRSFESFLRKGGIDPLVKVLDSHARNGS